MFHTPVTCRRHLENGRYSDSPLSDQVGGRGGGVWEVEARFFVSSSSSLSSPGEQMLSADEVMGNMQHATAEINQSRDVAHTEVLNENVIIIIHNCSEKNQARESIEKYVCMQKLTVTSQNTNTQQRKPMKHVPTTQICRFVLNRIIMIHVAVMWNTRGGQLVMWHTQGSHVTLLIIYCKPFVLGFTVGDEGGWREELLEPSGTSRGDKGPGVSLCCGSPSPVLGRGQSQH